MNLEFWSNIPQSSQNLFIASILLFGLSCFLFFTERKKFLLFLGISAFCMASAFALAMPWFYLWDEQFHALVGKNLAKNPFHPKLIDMHPSLIRGWDWAENHTWLHKQPLFLYQIALSIKILGNTVFAVRLPSVILHVVGVLALYDMGKMLLNKYAGYFTATLFLFAFYPLGLLSGRIGIDHNDAVFMIYVLLSFWAYFKYIQTPSAKWRNLIGLFVGLAILTKWVVGLLVFGPWGIFALIALKRKNTKEFNSMIKAVLIALIISLPWQIYIHAYFPIEANYELAYNARHFFEVIEGHGGGPFFHFGNFNLTFFSPFLLVVLLILSLGMALLKKRLNQAYLSLWIASLLLFLFFSLSATKMVSFIIPSLPLIFLIIGYGISEAIEFIQQIKPKKLVQIAAILLFIPIVFKADRTIEKFGFENGDVHLLSLQRTFIEQNGTDDPKTVIVNAALRGHGNIQWMYFTENKALAHLPTKEQITAIKKAGYSIKCIQWNDTLPSYILEDKSVELLKFE